eukprot:scaffold297842_cov31-Prasinocladus_malaysianus.AAC.1
MKWIRLHNNAIKSHRYENNDDTVDMMEKAVSLLPAQGTDEVQQPGGPEGHAQRSDQRPPRD